MSAYTSNDTDGSGMIPNVQFDSDHKPITPRVRTVALVRSIHNQIQEYPPLDYLNKCFLYDGETGWLIWKIRPCSHFKTESGRKIFNSNNSGKRVGYEQRLANGESAQIFVGMVVNGKKRFFSAHALIYRMHDMKVPDGMEIDHKDRNPFNNRMDNLRLSTKSQNMQNRRGWSKKKSGLPKGVCMCHGKFVARINVNGRQIRLGTFNCQENAKSAYDAAVQNYHGEFAAA